MIKKQQKTCEFKLTKTSKMFKRAGFAIIHIMYVVQCTSLIVAPKKKKYILEMKNRFTQLYITVIGKESDLSDRF